MLSLTKYPFILNGRLQKKVIWGLTPTSESDKNIFLLFWGKLDHILSTIWKKCFLAQRSWKHFEKFSKFAENELEAVQWAALCSNVGRTTWHDPTKHSWKLHGAWGTLEGVLYIIYGLELLENHLKKDTTVQNETRFIDTKNQIQEYLS